jgi:hypothetical protein
MQHPKPLNQAHSDLFKVLCQWLRTKKMFVQEHDDILSTIGQSSDIISASFFFTSEAFKELLEKGEDEDLMFTLVSRPRLIHNASMEMVQALHDETDSVVYCFESPVLFSSWGKVCVAVEVFARSAAQDLRDLWIKYQALDLVSKSALFDSALAIRALANAAMRCRKNLRTIIVNLVED